jgi:hypothetical protein
LVSTIETEEKQRQARLGVAGSASTPGILSER